MVHFSFPSKLQAACSANLVIYASASGVSKQPALQKSKPFLVGKSQATGACAPWGGRGGDAARCRFPCRGLGPAGEAAVARS